MKKTKSPAKKEADKQFFLYVFFHSMWTAAFNMFNDD